MRLILFLMVVTSLTMCKSKSKITPDEIVKYVVLLKKDVTIESFKKTIDHNIVDAKRSSRSQNQWLIDFEDEGKKSKNIKRDLLNNDLVISVLVPDENGNVKSTSGKKSKVPPLRNQEIQKY